MRKRRLSIVLTIVSLLLVGGLAQAQPRQTYRGTFQSVRRIILRVENRSNVFRSSIEDWTTRDSFSNPANQDISLFAREFDDSVRRLRTRFVARQSTVADVQDVLNRAARIEGFLNGPNVNVDARTRNQWTNLRVDLNQLANAYRVSWPQTGNNYPPYNNGNQSLGRLTGTYRIDSARSDDARLAAERAARGLAPSERRRVLDSLTQRLESPQDLALDVRGRTVTIASTRASQISFAADGRERVETSPSGRTIRSRATLTGDQLTVSTTGDTGNDFSVTFDSIENGRRLSVNRRVFVQGLSSPVVVQSVYDKTSEVARFNIYDPNASSSNTTFVVADNTRVIGILDETLTTRTAVVGDRFTLRVTDPAEFSGATIEGHVSHVERSGRLTGRSVMTLDFDTIRLHNGRSYRFAGTVETVRTASGNTVRVDTEGTVRDSSQTTQTQTRAAIGTAVGAIIGAIAGGGKGAAIGAIIGAGGGAGSVYVQGRNDLELARGTEIAIRSGAPINTGSR
ncbi:MAG TPA: YMGG-like glycine zipper-containing protein [Pyrinomonadaceae bacterium]|nr:YMGG-like glycine zipper-containing protein [Pyrinomonadaceae bacterium]